AFEEPPRVLPGWSGSRVSFTTCPCKLGFCCISTGGTMLAESDVSSVCSIRLTVTRQSIPGTLLTWWRCSRFSYQRCRTSYFSGPNSIQEVRRRMRRALASVRAWCSCRPALQLGSWLVCFAI
ncbi:hypothetical protein FOZ63_012628, partial [Perkinsus olseni]